MTDDSTPGPTPRKARPKRPRKDFPLRVHKGTGYWCKKVRGRVYYFGKVMDDPNGQAALEEYNRVRSYLEEGKEPPPLKPDELTVENLCDEFVAHKETMRDNGELNPRTFRGYYDIAAGVVETFGKSRVVVDLSPQDFAKLRVKLAKTRGAVALRNAIQQVRGIFKFAFDQGLILVPIRFGQSFAKPKLEVVRRAREEHREKYGDRMFEANELKLILDALAGNEVLLNQAGKSVKVTMKENPALRAMVLLAANCAFGQSDLARLPIRAVDLKSGWLSFARVKTAIARRILLWPETIEAIRKWIPLRPKAKDKADTGLVFLTCRGAQWVKVNKKGAPKDAILQEFEKVIRSLGLKRPRVSFYALQHGFETIALATADQVAVDAVMGHVPQGMAGLYRERIGDDRLRRVTEHVRQWLFGKGDTNDKPKHAELVARDSTALRVFAG
jgi:integrase